MAIIAFNALADGAHNTTLLPSILHLEHLSPDVRDPIVAFLPLADQFHLLLTSRTMYDAVVPIMYGRVVLDQAAAELFIEGLPIGETLNEAGEWVGKKEGRSRKLDALARTKYLALKDAPALATVFRPPPPSDSPPPVPSSPTSSIFIFPRTSWGISSRRSCARRRRESLR
ncbi:hypothetical protein IAT38_003000 [Cryptococcus sp. DSM 104549]